MKPRRGIFIPCRGQCCPLGALAIQKGYGAEEHDDGRGGYQRLWDEYGRPYILGFWHGFDGLTPHPLEFANGGRPEYLAGIEDGGRAAFAVSKYLSPFIAG